MNQHVSETIQNMQVSLPCRLLWATIVAKIDYRSLVSKQAGVYDIFPHRRVNDRYIYDT